MVLKMFLELHSKTASNKKVQPAAKCRSHPQTHNPKIFTILSKWEQIEKKYVKENKIRPLAYQPMGLVNMAVQLQANEILRNDV